MVNKYGNDAKNNIIWNIEYPFVPECTNKYGVVLHEGDSVLLDESYSELSHIKFKGTIIKIYNNDYIAVYAETEEYYKRKRRPATYVITGDDLELDLNCKDPIELIDYDNWCEYINHFQRIINRVYTSIYGIEITDEFIDEVHARDLERIKSQSR